MTLIFEADSESTRPLMAPDFFRPVRSIIFIGWMAISAAAGLSQDVMVEEQTLANGLRMIHLDSDAFEGAALAMQWTFKPGLELDKTGTREAWAHCLDAQWKADTAGTGWDLTWQITPFGFLADGNAEDWAAWSTALLQGIFEGAPASYWDSVRAKWIADWDAIEHEPNRLRQRAVAHAIFSSRHIYGEVATTESLQAISTEGKSNSEGKESRPEHSKRERSPQQAFHPKPHALTAAAMNNGPFLRLQHFHARRTACPTCPARPPGARDAWLRRRLRRRRCLPTRWRPGTPPVTRWIPPLRA